MMIISEKILQAVVALTGKSGNAVFSREDIRTTIGVDREDWNASYSPIFQGMRADQPGGAPNVGQMYKNVFAQVSHGKHTLTEYGKKLINEKTE